jgi:cell division protein FtsB
MEKTKIEENKNKRKFNLRIFNKILFILIIAVGVIYVAGANDLVIKGFRLNELKKDLNGLSGENIKLESNIINLSSYSNLNRKIAEIGMVKTGQADYILAGAGLVAKK